MTTETFIKLSRGLKDWEWFHNSNMVHIWVYFLLKANYKETKYQGHRIPAGSFVGGRKAISAATGISEKTVRTCIAKLIATGEVASKGTTKFTIYTLKSWKKYQIVGKKGQQPTQQGANDGPHLKKERSKEYNRPTVEEVAEYVKEKDLNLDPVYFFNHFEASNWVDKNGNEVKVWKQKAQTWSKLATQQGRNNKATLPVVNQNVKQYNPAAFK
jgi:hypothetical protein